MKRNYIREWFKPFYEGGHLAHTIEHADDVCDLALMLNHKHYNHKYNDDIVMIAAYAHDMYNAKDRKIHEILAAEYIIKTNDDIIQTISNQDRVIISLAIAQHRASFKEELSTELSEIISSADRGIPNLQKTIDRSMKFNNGDYIQVVEHIKNKYGEGGYAKYPGIYNKIFKKEIKEFRYQISKL